MTYTEIVEQIKTKKSFLCVGLDTDLDKVAQSVLKTDNPIFEFNKAIIEATHKYTVAYKPNIAFYERYGLDGWRSLEKTVDYIRTNYDNIFLIADAKRGDIGNTSKMYAKTFFETFDFDAVTVNPYMGSDSVIPFLDYNNKWVILLTLTSNHGADDFQTQKFNGSKPLYISVLEKSLEWGTADNLMYVVGATQAEMLVSVRQVVPDHFLLVPGVGAQGGSLSQVADNGINKNCGLLVNSSRQIIYASTSKTFASDACRAAEKIQLEMTDIINNKI